MKYKLGFVKNGAFTLIRTYDTKEQAEEAKSNLSKRSIYKGILTIRRTMTQKDFEPIMASAKYLDAALEEEREELIDKACEWFEEVIVNVKFRKGGMTSCYTGIKSFIHNFRKAMEE